MCPNKDCDNVSSKLCIVEEKIISKYGSEQGAIDSLNEFKDKLEALNESENELVNIPVTDSPLMLTFGDFCEWEK